MTALQIQLSEVTTIEDLSPILRLATQLGATAELGSPSEAAGYGVSINWRMDTPPSLALSHIAALIVAVDMLGSGSDVEREVDVLRRNVSEIVSMLDASKRLSEDGTPEEIDIEVIREPLLRTQWTHDSDDINLKPWD